MNESSPTPLHYSTPIYSRVIIGKPSLPASTFHMQSNQLSSIHSRENLKIEIAQNQQQLISRILEEADECQRLRQRLHHLESRNIQLEQEMNSMVQMIEERNADQLRIVEIQEKHIEKIKKLQEQLKQKDKKESQQAYWQDRYRSLNKNVTNYTGQISQMQAQFRSQCAGLKLELEAAEESRLMDRRRIQMLQEQLVDLKNQKAQVENTISLIIIERNSLERTLKQLEKQNYSLLTSSKTISQELSKCTELVDRLFVEVKEKSNQLKQKSDNIAALEKHLNASLEEIERLNDLLRSSIDSDNRAIEEIQRLDIKVTESKGGLEVAKLQIQDKLFRISQMQTENRGLSTTCSMQKELIKELEAKMVVCLANEQRMKDILEEKNSRVISLQSQVGALIKELSKKSDGLAQELKRRDEERREQQRRQPERRQPLRRESQGRQLQRREDIKTEVKDQISQEIQKFRKIGQTKNIKLTNIKQRGKQFKLNDFQQKLERYSATRHGMQSDGSQNNSPARISSPLKSTRARFELSETSNSLKKVVGQISNKVTEIVQKQSSRTRIVQHVNNQGYEETEESEDR